MKKILPLFFLAFIVLFTSCEDSNSFSDAEGTVSFWANGPAYNGIDIWINDDFKGSVSEHFNIYTPDCNEAGTLTLALEPGTYSYRAYQRDYFEWTGKFTISDGTCTSTLLDQ